VFRRFWIVAWLLATSVLLIATPAEAAANHVGNPYSLVLDSWPVLLAAGCGWLSSQATAFLTHRRAPQWIKSGVHLLLASLAGVLITVVVIPTKTWKDYAAEIFVAWLSGVISKVAGWTEFVGNATANVGIGANVKPLTTPPPEDASDNTAF
jgi:hypothetical protein